MRNSTWNFLISLLAVNLLFTTALLAQDESPPSPLSCPSAFLELTFEQLTAREQTAVTGIAKLTLKLETGKIAYDTVEDVKNHLINTRIELRDRLIRNYFKSSLTSDNNIELTNHLDLLVSDLIRYEIYKMQGRQDELLAKQSEMKKQQLELVETEHQRQLEQAKLQKQYEELKGNDEFPLISATKYGEIERLEKLLANPYSNPIEMDNKGFSPLHWAAINGHTHIVKLFLNTPGFMPEWLEIKDKLGCTLLHKAAMNGFSEIVKLILNTSGFNLEQLKIQDQFDYTPLHWAAENGHSKVFKLIFESHDFRLEWLELQNTYGYTPFHLAASEGHADIVKLILNTPGFNPEWLMIQSNEGYTPLRLAVMHRHTEIVRILEEKLKITKSTQGSNAP